MLGRGRLILCARPPRTQDLSDLIRSGGARWMRARKDRAALPSVSGERRSRSMRAVNDNLAIPRSSF